MKVESEEQGVRFEWGAEPDTVVKVGLAGDREQVYERMTVLHEVIRSQRHEGVPWLDLEMRERHVLQGPWKGKVLLVWAGQFATWQEAGVAFAVLCKAVGMEDDGVALEVEM